MVMPLKLLLNLNLNLRGRGTGFEGKKGRRKEDLKREGERERTHSGATSGGWIDASIFAATVTRHAPNHLSSRFKYKCVCATVAFLLGS